MQQTQQVDATSTNVPPTPEELTAMKAVSPSKKRKAPTKYICTQCGITYGSTIDKQYNGENYKFKWIGCSAAVDPECMVWEHHYYNGLVNVKSVEWLCEMHRPKPPKSKSVMKKKRQ